MPVRDLIIVGAGPSGLATAIAAKRQGLDYVVVEKGRCGETVAAMHHSVADRMHGVGPEPCPTSPVTTPSTV